MDDEESDHINSEDSFEEVQEDGDDPGDVVYTSGEEEDYGVYEEPLGWKPEGPDAVYLSKLLLKPNEVDPNNFKTCVDKGRIVQWLANKKYLRRNLRRNFQSTATFAQAVGILNQAGLRPEGLPGYNPDMATVKKKKTSTKKTAKKTRTAPVVGGGGGDAPAEAAAAAVPLACPPGETMVTSRVVTCDKFMAPTMLLRIFTSDDMDSKYRTKRKRASLLLILVSGMRPEDVRVIQKHVNCGGHCGSQFLVKWRIPKELRQADFVMARNAIMDSEFCNDLEEFMNDVTGGWQEHPVDLGFQTEGFFRDKHFRKAEPEAVHWRWSTPPIQGANGRFQAACVYVTTFEVAHQADEDRYDDLDDYSLEQMTLSDVEYLRRNRGGRFQPAPPPPPPPLVPRPRRSHSNNGHSARAASRTPPRTNRKPKLPLHHTPPRGQPKEDELQRRRREYQEWLKQGGQAAAASKPKAKPAPKAPSLKTPPRRGTPTRPGKPYRTPPAVHKEREDPIQMEVDDLPKTSFEEENSGRYYNKRPFGGVNVKFGEVEDVYSEEEVDDEEEEEPVRTPKRNRDRDDEDDDPYAPPQKQQQEQQTTTSNNCGGKGTTNNELWMAPVVAER
ncbi:hypothetical protein SEMRO_962_G225170.1 [Seminavis robusta]|uniref:Uncharacterized protein n=1 Tax=Seminavis robusta TaxID=568900 RepID=A0A9N8HN56_9STRA|nr:hypothetical protein SEMRO_962_G225170.1 [Seminavis robusta]|eukprot:Sro962_g225170.1 n/a (612) ;mRNA; r:29679-31826